MLILIITHEFCPIFLLKQTVKVIKTVSNPHGLRLAVDMKFRIHIRIHMHDFTWISMDISISMDASIFRIRELHGDKNFSPLQPSPFFLSLSPLHHHRVGSIPGPSPQGVSPSSPCPHCSYPHSHPRPRDTKFFNTTHKSSVSII